MRNFEYHRPGTLDEAVELLRGSPDAKLLGGGQSLLPLMKLDLAEPSRLVSVAGLPGLGDVATDDGHLVVGAAVTHAEVARSREVRDAVPALAELARRIGDPQVRNRGTLGGSIAHADPAADYPAALLALDAVVVTDRREIAADEFFQGLFRTALEPDEVVTRVRFAVPERAAWAKFQHPASRFAVVGVMVAAGPSGVRVGVTGAGPSVFRAHALEDALGEGFSERALANVRVPADDLLSDDAASAEYRAHLVGVLARRAVASA